MRPLTAFASSAGVAAFLGVCCLGFLGWLGAALGIGVLIAFSDAPWADLVLIPAFVVSLIVSVILWERARGARKK